MLLIICGKSGSGKDALLKRLVQHYGFCPIISTTSRPPRFGEMNGVEYNFVSKEKFLELIDRDVLLRDHVHKDDMMAYCDDFVYETAIEDMPTIIKAEE